MQQINLKDIIAPAFRSVHRVVKNNEKTHIWLKGGRAGGKSAYVSQEIPLGIMKDPAANAVVIRKVDKDLRESVFEQIKWGIETLGCSAYWKFYTSPMKAVYLPTGQRIAFRGAEEPERFKSMKFAKGYCKFVWYEELPEFTPQDLQVINPSLLRGGDKFIVFYTYNPPQSVQAWVNTEANMPNSDRLVHHSTYLDMPRQWIGEQFIIDAEHMQKVNPEAYAHIYLGEVTGTGGEVFRNVRLERITDEQIAQFDKQRRGLDFGYASDPLHYAESHYDKTRRRLYVYGEYHATAASNRTAVDNILRIAGDGKRVIMADSAEPRTINEFRDLGLSGIRPVTKGKDSVEHGIKYMQDLEAIIIDPERCPNTAREFTQYELERDKNGNFKAQYPDKNNHSIDAVRYSLNDDMRAALISVLK